MNVRYLILVGCVDQTEANITALAARASAAFTTSCVTRHDRIWTIANHAGVAIDLGDQGHLVGDLFPRQGPSKREAFTRDQGLALTKGDGERLLTHFWGNYVAALRREDQWLILRAPMGVLPAYYVSGDGWTAIASDPRALADAGLLQPKIDWLEIAKTHYLRDLPSSRTAFVGVSELLPGAELAISRDNSLSVGQRWSPWTYVRPCAGRDMQSRLRQVVQNAVAALTLSFDRPLLGLSGGLDSSIVAACLGQRDQGYLALTMISCGGGGDERKYARLVAATTGTTLLERSYLLGDVDLGEAVARHQPRPCGWIHERAYQAAVFRAAAECEADVYVTGNGGDNVFYNSSSARVVLDRAYTSGFSRALIRSVGDLARLTQSSVGEVIRETWKIYRKTGRGYRWRRFPRLLHGDVVTALDAEPPRHPWLEQPADGLPGKSAQIAMMLRMHYHLDSFDRAQVLPIVNPLAAQPVVELCLGIPSWESIREGHDRMAARSAFEDDLPASVMSRRTKGSPDGFALELLETRLPEIRERLLEGELVQRGILDRDALEAATHPVVIRDGRDHPLLLALLDTEAWVRHWLKPQPLPPTAFAAVPTSR